MAIVKKSQAKIQVIDETADLTEEQIKKAAKIVKKYEKDSKKKNELN